MSPESLGHNLADQALALQAEDLSFIPGTHVKKPPGLVACSGDLGAVDTETGGSWQFISQPSLLGE